MAALLEAGLRIVAHDRGFGDAETLRRHLKSLSLELAPHGTPVNATAPKFLDSETYFPRARFIPDPAGREFVARSVPIGRLARPEALGEVNRFPATLAAAS